MQTCKSCGEEKPNKDFPRDGARLRPSCLACWNLKRRAQAAPDPRPTAPLGDCATGFSGAHAPDAETLTPIETARVARSASARKRDLLAEHRALLDENERLSRLLNISKSIRAPIAPEVISRPPDTLGDAVACVLLSDWHLEEPVDKTEMHGLNEFNLEIARERARMFFVNALKLTHIQASACTIRRVWCAMLGDIITNHLHDDNKIHNLLQPSDAINFALESIISGVNYWLKESDFAFDFDGVCGNHGRTTRFMPSSHPEGTSLETFLYRAIQNYYRDEPRVSFTLAPGAMAYRRYFNFTARMVHGYEIGYQGGIGGVTIPIRKKIASWDKSIKADLTAMGHFHQLLNGGDHIVNGSLIGYNTYARQIGASPEPARQAFFLIHSHNGGELAATAPIWLDNAR